MLWFARRQAVARGDDVHASHEEREEKVMEEISSAMVSETRWRMARGHDERGSATAEETLSKDMWRSKGQGFKEQAD